MGAQITELEFRALSVSHSDPEQIRLFAHVTASHRRGKREEESLCCATYGDVPVLCMGVSEA